MEAYFSYRLLTTYRLLGAVSLPDTANLHLLNLTLLSFARLLRENGHTPGYLAAHEPSEIRVALERFPGHPSVVAFSCAHQSSIPILSQLARVAHEQWNATTVAGGSILNLYRSLEQVDILAHGNGAGPLLSALALAPALWKPDFVFYPDLSVMPAVVMPVSRIYFQKGCLVPGLSRCRACMTLTGRQLQLAHKIPCVLEALQVMHERFGTRIVFIADDDFLLNPANAQRILNTLRERALPVQFFFQCRVSSFLDFVSSVGKETVRALLRDAGVVEVQLGAESTSPRMLRQWWAGKYNPVQLEPALDMARTLGIYTLCNFQFGLPGETLAEMETTGRTIVRLMESGCLDFADLYFPHLPRRMFSSGEINRYGIIFDDRPAAQSECPEFPSMWHREGYPGAPRHTIISIRNECLGAMAAIHRRRVRELGGSLIRPPRKVVT